MRVVRSVLGVLLALIGLIIAVAGGAAAFWLIGPDDTVHSGDQHLTSKGLAIATAPDLLDRHGPVLHVDVHSASGGPVFVGVARDFDVASYLKGFAHTTLVQVEYPIALTTDDQKGLAGPLQAPDTLDWWVAKANGSGTQSITWPIADGPYDVVIMNADGKTPPDLQADLGIEIPHAFLAALGVLLAGLILLALGILLILVRRRRPADPQPVYAAPAVPAPPVATPPNQTGALHRGVVIGLALTLLTGCSAVPQRDTVESLTRPAITDETAAAVLKHQSEVASKANSARDEKLAATVEGGSLLLENQAAYTIGRAAKAKPDKPFSYLKPTIGAPESSSYPMRFVSSAGFSTTKDYRHLGLWERTTAGSPWKLTVATGVRTTVKLPALAGLRPVTTVDKAKLVADPQVAATALATYLTDGTKSPRAASFAPNADITRLLADLVQRKAADLKDGSARNVSDTFAAPHPPVAFMTTSGTALVFASLNQDYTLLVAQNYNYWWAGLPETAFSPLTAKYESALTRMTLCDAVLLIPPKGKGKIQIAAFQSQVVGAGGY